ncbi:hypothetical protein EDB85DRAFT_2076347 [Lactarius pseudohatsudake]|nr:hypothetical protein EDB85DRAFT_2076347 [Lactarius pseudohatsudake]
MFKKPLADIKTFAPLRSSDRRKFKARMTERFQLAPEIADTLVPDGLLVRKFRAYNGNPSVLYVSTDGDPLWFGVGKGSSSPSDDLIPTVYTLWKYPTLLPTLTIHTTVVPVLVSGADLMVPGVMQAPAHTLTGALVSITQFSCDARGPPLAVGRMAIDADKIDNNTMNKRKAVSVLHTSKDHLWALGSRGGQPDALQVVAAATAVGSETTGGASDGDDSADRNDGGTDAPQAGADQEPAENAPAVTQDGPVKIEEIEKLTPEEVSTLLRAALLQALRTSLAALPNSAFPMPASTLYTAHILPARPFSRTAATPVDIKHSTFKSLSAFLRASEKGGLLKLKHARSDVQVAAMFLTHADVVTHQAHRTVGEEDERRRRAKEREAQQAAEVANAEKAITVTELWKPHLGALPLFEDLGLDTAALYPLANVKSALFTYAEKHDLVNRFRQQFINVRSDAVLAAALYGPQNAKGTTPAPEFAKREEALSTLCKRMQPLYRIAVSGDESIVKKGALSSITVTAKGRKGHRGKARQRLRSKARHSKTRQGRYGRACTHITGFEAFHLSADALAEALRVPCASSTWVSLVSSGGQEVVVQGKQTQVVLKLLESLGVPKNWIETAGIKDKKK